MTKIYSIKYFDSVFSYEKETSKNSELKIHECFGYVQDKKTYLQVSFIQCKIDSKKCNIEGLLIPKNALISKRVKTKNIPIGSKIAITWEDIVHFKNTLPKKCPKMHTEGILIKQNKNYLIIKDPETIRINPKPIKNHPEQKPTFYKIHTPIIINIDILK